MGKMMRVRKMEIKNVTANLARIFFGQSGCAVVREPRAAGVSRDPLPASHPPL